MRQLLTIMLTVFALNVFGQANTVVVSPIYRGFRVEKTIASDSVIVGGRFINTSNLGKVGIQMVVSIDTAEIALRRDTLYIISQGDMWFQADSSIKTFIVDGGNKFFWGFGKTADLPFFTRFSRVESVTDTLKTAYFPDLSVIGIPGGGGRTEAYNDSVYLSNTRFMPEGYAFDGNEFAGGGDWSYAGHWRIYDVGAGELSPAIFFQISNNQIGTNLAGGSIRIHHDNGLQLIFEDSTFDEVFIYLQDDIRAVGNLAFSTHDTITSFPYSIFQLAKDTGSLFVGSGIITGLAMIDTTSLYGLDTTTMGISFTEASPALNTGSTAWGLQNDSLDYLIFNEGNEDGIQILARTASGNKSAIAAYSPFSGIDFSYNSGIGTVLFNINDSISTNSSFIINTGKSLFISDATNVDTMRFYDDGNTSRWTSDNPIEITTSNVNITGTLTVANQLRRSVTTQSANYTASATDYFIIMTNAGDTVFLPAGSGNKEYDIINKSAGNIEVDADGAETIGNVSSTPTVTLGTGEALGFLWDGTTNWAIKP